jgi:hypothetical protein
MTKTRKRVPTRPPLRTSLLSLALLFAAVALVGCHYEESICDSSPGSGCAACTASCQQDYEYDHHDQARKDECDRQCNEGEWRTGLPRGCGDD